MHPEIPSLTKDGAPAITDAAALVVVGALRDLRLQLEINNGLLLEAHHDQKRLRDEIKRLGDVALCVEDSIGQAAQAWFELARRVLPEKEQGNDGP